MARYLIDANLPYYFSVWRGSDYLHLLDLDDSWPDSRVWAYARERGLTIVTKDAEFSDRALLQEPPPRVVHVRLGNLRMRDFHSVVSAIWPDVCTLLERCRLVQVFPDRIEGIE